MNNSKFENIDDHLFIQVSTGGCKVVVLKDFRLPPACIISYAKQEGLIRENEITFRLYGDSKEERMSIQKFFRDYTLMRFSPNSRVAFTLNIGTAIDKLYLKVFGHMGKIITPYTSPTEHAHRYYLNFMTQKIERKGKDGQWETKTIPSLPLLIETKKIQLIE